MKANEIRIGNWVSKDGEQYQSTTNTPQIIERGAVIEPITITEEWLLNFGFKKDNSRDYWIDLQTHYLELMQSDGYWYPIYVQIPEMSCDEEQRVSLNRIQYVHELQNLIFALTNQELTINEDSI